MCLNKHFLYCIIKKYNYFCKRSKENIVKIFSSRRQHWLFAADCVKNPCRAKARLRSLSQTGLISSVGFAYRAIED